MCVCVFATCEFIGSVLAPQLVQRRLVQLQYIPSGGNYLCVFFIYVFPMCFLSVFACVYVIERVLRGV